MKILAIRGENLASLERIDIDFESDPLSRAGLFAICGPTGAGKSTILDALCVALFDKTPRLGGGKSSDVLIGWEEQGDKERLRATDVRGLLRRGAGEGFAEVDFVGRDSRRYRARWDVWRARRKATGRLQAQSMSLEDLESGKNLSGTKTETLEAIEARLGLSFEQFRRSALLAQGEFAAFLRADERNRSELLERMTGTEVYGALSQAAFERKKAERAELDKILAEVETHAILGGEDRDALEADQVAARASLSAIESELGAAQDAASWHRRRDELASDERAAQQAVITAEQAFRDAEPLRRELEDVLRARTYRPVIEASDRAHAAVEQVERELAECQQRANDSAEARDLVRQRVAEIERELTGARSEYDEARPGLRQAERLDAEILAAARVAESTARAWRDAADTAARMRDDRARVAETLTAKSRAAREAEAWLDGHRHIEPLAAQWPRWQSALEEYERVTNALEARVAERPGLHDALAAAESALASARDEHRESKEELERARARNDRAQRAADQVPLDAARKARDTMSTRLDALRRLAEVQRGATTARQTETGLREQADQSRVAADEADTRAETLSFSIHGSAAALAEAEHAFDRLRLASDLDQHRVELVSGEPCPLCGATEHPWSDDASPVARLVDEQRVRLEGLRTRHQSLEARRAMAQASARELRRRVESCEGELEVCALALGRARETWKDELVSLGELALIDDPAGDGAAHWLETRLEAAGQEMARLGEDEAQAAQLAEAARQAHGVMAARESDLFQARTALAEREEQTRAATSRLAECDAALERAASDIDRLTASLRAALSGRDAAPDSAPASSSGDDWRAELQRDPVGFRERCAGDVTAWDEYSDALARSSKDRDALASKLEAIEDNLETQQAREDQAAAERDATAAGLDQVREERAGLFDGQSTADVRDRLTGAIEELDARAREARSDEQQCVERAASAAARARALVERRDQAIAERERADSALGAAEGEAGVDLATLRRRSQTDEGWITSRRDQIETLEQNLQQARNVRDERMSQRHKHEASGPPSLQLDEADEIIARSQEARQQAHARLSTITASLERDDQARAARADMAAQVSEQERRTRLYSTLSELIGSHDGKKFRVFAQSLTLDALLAYANRHLEDLASRYRMIRVPGYDLDLQVIDRDMGDEVRSINSLSGGESFLVSLALALGLSSLAARDTRVESLLIDEGFGSLDPTSLDTALSVLDALQATGRKVGLISHVPGLAERVGVRIMVRPQGGGRSSIRVSER